jgi:hypothetical protein
MPLQSGLGQSVSVQQFLIIQSCNPTILQSHKSAKSVSSAFQKKLHLGKKAMNKQSLLTTFALLLLLNCWSQEKTNPILFSEYYFGPAFGSSGGFSNGVSLNYQTKENLLTLRYTNNIQLEGKFLFVFFPAFEVVEQTDEFALLYGRRKTYGNHSFSYSAGVGYVKHKEFINVENDVRNYEIQDGVGLPFEVNIKWFNVKKERYRIYFLIPVGQPTSFSRSIGFKLYGNLSKTSFVGLGINYGFGWHKNY